MADAPMTVVETAEFLKQAARLTTDSECQELVSYVGANPEAGDIMPETGGVRKLRWAREGMGKRGGTRVIYYYHNERLPRVSAHCVSEEPDGESQQSRA